MAIRLAAFAKNGVNPNYRAFLRGVERAAAAEGATATRHVPATPDDPAQQIALLRATSTASSGTSRWRSNMCGPAPSESSA